MPRKPKRIVQLEELARNLVGDDKSPDLYFVTDQGNVVTVSRNLDVAYAHWRELQARRPLVECALENRQYGVLASVEPDDDTPNAPLRIHDDTGNKTYARLVRL